jgi:ABC-type transport system involved in multi-copper enzyme maturation permease subunit
MNLLRAWTWLLSFSLRRLWWSTQTLMVAFPLALCGLFLWRRQYAAIEPVSRALERFSQEFVLLVLTSFIVPICSLAYATTSVSADREDQTLLFLLVRPLPRPLVLLAKLLATLPIVLGLVIGSFYLFCRAAGPAGELAFSLYWSPLALMAVAYVGLFHLFAVTFRHATIIALLYSFFMEFFLGNMPGIVKRVAVNFYGRSMIFDLGADHGLEPPNPEWFVPLAAGPARQALLWIALGSALLAALIFQRREYRDLN